MHKLLCQVVRFSMVALIFVASSQHGICFIAPRILENLWTQYTPYFTIIKSDNCFSACICLIHSNVSTLHRLLLRVLTTVLQWLNFFHIILIYKNPAGTQDNTQFTSDYQNATFNILTQSLHASKVVNNMTWSTYVSCQMGRSTGISTVHLHQQHHCTFWKQSIF